MRGEASVRRAIHRWLGKGLITGELAAQLTAEIEAGARGRSRSTAQYLVAVTASLALLAASTLFVARSWPDLEMASRTLVLGLVGLLILVSGSRLERRPRVRPVGYLLRTSGLLVLLVACAHSDRTWPEESTAGIIVGLLALAAPFVSAALSQRRDPVMPAVNMAAAYAFLAFFLNRVGVHEDHIVWILDGVLLLSVALLVIRLRAVGPDSEGTSRLLYAFVTSLLAGLVLAGFTAAGPLDAEGGTIYALDLWLAAIVAIALWAVHRAPPWLARPWYDEILAAAVVLGALFASITLYELGLDEDWTAAGGGLVGALGMAYGIRQSVRSVLLAGCLSVTVSVWIFSVQQGGSMGAVGALAFTAALLFWVAARLGRDGTSGISSLE